VKITGTNLFALGRLFGVVTVHGRNSRDTGCPQVLLRSVPNRIEATSRTHLKRCIAAGLLDVQGSQLILTDAGHEALIELMERHTR
jgi:hypothetical protein